MIELGRGSKRPTLHRKDELGTLPYVGDITDHINDRVLPCIFGARHGTGAKRVSPEQVHQSDAIDLHQIISPKCRASVWKLDQALEDG